MPESASVVTVIVCCRGPFHTSETRSVTVASGPPPPITVHIVPSIIFVAGGGFSKSTTSPEKTAFEPDRVSCGVPGTVPQEQAVAQSGRRADRARVSRTKAVRRANELVDGMNRVMNHLLLYVKCRARGQAPQRRVRSSRGAVRQTARAMTAQMRTG